MKGANLKAMSLEQLIGFRTKIDQQLSTKVGEQRRDLQSQLDRLESFRGAAKRGPKKSARKGRKVPPKYRGPKGETWAGRGMRPLWLTALLKQGKKLQEFAVGDKGSPKPAPETPGWKAEIASEKRGRAPRK